MAAPKQRLGFAYRFVVYTIRPILMVLTRRDWRGAKHLPPVGTGVVVVVNHISHVDPLTFAHFLWDNGRAPRYLAKEGLFRTPVIGKIVAACGQIPVYRESSDAARAYRDGVAAVKSGECVAIYPEGTITRDPGLWPMTGKTGAARVALETGCPVIPIAQWGPQALLPPYSKRLRPFPRKTMQVLAGPPIDLSDLSDQPLNAATLHEATRRIMTAITNQLAVLRAEVPPVQPFDPRANGLPTTGNPKKRPDSADGNSR